MNTQKLEHKQCFQCQKILPIDHFFTVTGNSDSNDWYISTACKCCHAKAIKEILADILQEKKSDNSTN